MVAWLLGVGADANAVDVMGNTALHAAARVDSGACMRVLLEHGASPRIANKAGMRVAQARWWRARWYHGAMYSLCASVCPLP